MNKNIKNAIVLVVIFLIIFLIAFLGYDLINKKKKEQIRDGNDIQIKDSNTGLDNIINTLFEVPVNAEDSISLEKENLIILNGTSSKREEEAIAIAKKNYGVTDGVYYSIMGINAKEKYIVSVNDMNTARILKLYEIDVETRRCIEKQ